MSVHCSSIFEKCPGEGPSDIFEYNVFQCCAVGCIFYRVIEIDLEYILKQLFVSTLCCCLLYTSDAADEEDSVDLGGRRMQNHYDLSSIQIDSFAEMSNTGILTM